METEAPEDRLSPFAIGWPVGDFYVPGFASDWRTAWVPGAADTHRRLFLIRAARLEPRLLTTLRRVGKDERALLAWAEHWHLTDQWCVILARDTLRWWAADPEERGWAFEGSATAVGHFPFEIEPLSIGPFYHDPTWRTREAFEKYVLGQVEQALNDYCERIEAEALRAGLKRAPRKRAIEHLPIQGTQSPTRTRLPWLTAELPLFDRRFELLARLCAKNALKGTKSSNISPD